jgi:hypothetical protein
MAIVFLTKLIKLFGTAKGCFKKLNSEHPHQSELCQLNINEFKRLLSLHFKSLNGFRISSSPTCHFLSGRHLIIEISRGTIHPHLVLQMTKTF